MTKEVYLRCDGRLPHQLRKVQIRKNFQKNAAGSCLIEMGETRVVCSASVDDKVPPFLRNTGKGWLTAEYGMLPGSCQGRIEREAARGKQSGRTQEIQRLIGRSLRSVVDLTKMGERTIILDADVLQGDGGTRTASITGCFIALAMAVDKLIKSGALKQSPIKDFVAAVSVGMIGGEALLDLCYAEDSKAEVDMNVVMTGSGQFVEVQGTAEGEPFSGRQMEKLVSLAEKGIRHLVLLQKKAVKISA